ncbi:hypothetical protein [Niabella ginsengisoli]|uniref:hypothetical protein n=1 Tax=Niabella ginsengisoli TaxID=522298 RepID=UPI00374D9827
MEPLAQTIFDQTKNISEEEIAAFFTEQVKDKTEALQGARDIIAEWVAESEQARTLIRSMFQESSTISARVLSTKKNQKKRKNTATTLSLKSL